MIQFCIVITKLCSADKQIRAWLAETIHNFIVFTPIPSLPHFKKIYITDTIAILFQELTPIFRDFVFALNFHSFIFKTSYDNLQKP